MWSWSVIQVAEVPARASGTRREPTGFGVCAAPRTGSPRRVGRHGTDLGGRKHRAPALGGRLPEGRCAGGVRIPGPVAPGRGVARSRACTTTPPGRYRPGEIRVYGSSFTELYGV
ncbi:hypothetical protein GCM10018773_33690 [Streptomyces candidus]|nr:hypothetical protein GCM10018773_33690 [Streptomyces candidus]